MKAKPIKDKVIVKPDEPLKKTAGGIIIPDDAQEKPRAGLVLAVGPGSNDYPMTVKEGDRIMYGKYAGSEVTLEGEEVIIMSEVDIMLILN